MTPVAREWTTHAIGGAAVLGTYAWGAAQPNVDALWGRLPVEAIGPYTACMPFAAVGYLVTMAWSLQRTRRGDTPWTPTFAMILAASAAWLPLCFVDMANPSRAGWWLIQADLATTGLGGVAAAAGAVVGTARGRLARRRPRRLDRVLRADGGARRAHLAPVLRRDLSRLHVPALPSGCAEGREEGSMRVGFAVALLVPLLGGCTRVMVYMKQAGTNDGPDYVIVKVRAQQDVVYDCVSEPNGKDRNPTCIRVTYRQGSVAADAKADSKAQRIND